MPSQLAPVTLPGIQRPVRQELDLVLAELVRVIASDFPIIGEVNHHLIRMKGKMFRPTLALLSAQAIGSVGPRQVSLAAVVELIHLATLVHDDSVDHSVLRRGQPTVNAFFSHEIAVIMGDYLYSRAMMELVKGGDIEPMRIMARVTNDMTVGEMRELEAHDVLSHTEEDYELMIKAKTASLMSGACELGALSASDPVRGALKRYGMYLGMAFQVTDDLLDYTGSESVTGKPSGLDLREHKITLPLIAALPRMSREDRGLVERLMADPAPSDGLIESVINVVDARGGLAAAHERAQQFSLQAEAELDEVQPGPARDALRDCLVYAIERRS